MLEGLKLRSGKSRSPAKYRLLMDPVPGLPEYVWVRGSEEEFDVHLATRLLVDGIDDQFDQATVVSDDAGLPVQCAMFATSLACVSRKAIRTPATQAPAPHGMRLPALVASGSAI